ncbi:MAG TPA: protease modulator HflK [Steroidobacteraceae bacterium]|nr:protease modulator HflK [Steroidobacteraceae bacterium]
METSAKDRPTGDSVYPRSHRLVRRLLLVYAVSVLAVIVLLLLAMLPPGMGGATRGLAHEAVAGGLGATVLAALLLSLTGLAATLALTLARFRWAGAQEQGRRAPDTGWRHALNHPGVAARLGQAVLVPAGAILIYLALRLLWPYESAPDNPTHANILAAFVFALTFVSLVCERVMVEFPEPQLPEAPALRRLLLLTTVLLGACACIELGRGVMLSWVRWPQWVVGLLPLLVALELAGRALARLFLPAPAASSARAATDSILASVVTGGPRAPGTLLKTHLGLDFTRSWALAFLSAAVLPALLGTALFCWALTGVKLIELGQRGIYERFGAPVAVLGPGLHVLLPWPLGRLRPVEFGTIHSVAIGVDDQSAPGASERVSAEEVPPLSLNRLWESAHAGQANYLVPSAGSGQQGFQSVSTEISVLYRVGLTDAAALQSVYRVADPESLIREAGSRIVLRYFNSRTLVAVLGERRDDVAASLRDALAADLDSHHAGVEVVSVLIEEIHPPAGAAGAYHAVQAAEINANASISDERGRAQRVAGVAQQEAHQLTTAADAAAIERVDAANADAYRFAAERRADAEGGQSFLFERRVGKLVAALGQKPLTLLDHRLGSAPGPIIDLRAPAAARAGTAGAPDLGTMPPANATSPAAATGLPAAPPAPPGPTARPLTPDLQDAY